VQPELFAELTIRPELLSELVRIHLALLQFSILGHQQSVEGDEPNRRLPDMVRPQFRISL